VSLAEDNLNSTRAKRNAIRESLFEEVGMDEDKLLLLLLESVKNENLEVLTTRNIVL
jgi:hypothetical protein